MRKRPCVTRVRRPCLASPDDDDLEDDYEDEDYEPTFTTGGVPWCAPQRTCPSAPKLCPDSARRIDLLPHATGATGPLPPLETCSASRRACPRVPFLCARTLTCPSRPSQVCRPVGDVLLPGPPQGRPHRCAHRQASRPVRANARMGISRTPKLTLHHTTQQVRLPGCGRAQRVLRRL